MLTPEVKAPSSSSPDGTLWAPPCFTHLFSSTGAPSPLQLQNLTSPRKAALDPQRPSNPFSYLQRHLPLGGRTVTASCTAVPLAPLAPPALPRRSLLGERRKPHRQGPPEAESGAPLNRGVSLTQRGRSG